MKVIYITLHFRPEVTNNDAKELLVTLQYLKVTKGLEKVKSARLISTFYFHYFCITFEIIEFL